MSDIRRVCGPYQVSEGTWRLIFKHDDGSRSSGYYKTQDEALAAIESTEQAVSARLGSDALAFALLSQAVPCPEHPSWIYFLRDDSGAVIYVGVTGQIGGRLDSHLEGGKTFSSASIVPAVFDRGTALELERMLVRTLRPRLNVHHNPGPEAGELGACVGVHLDQTENDGS